MKRILIVGVAGFLGRTISRYFHRKGASVYGVDLVSAENAPQADMDGYESMLLPNDRFSSLMEKWRPQVCIHCGGRASIHNSMLDPESDYRSGPALTFSLLNTIRYYNCAFILLSSAAVYGNPQKLPVREHDPLQPISTYGYHKWQSEILCQEFSNLYSVKTASMRIFSAYGPGLRRQVVWDLAYKLLTQDEVVLQGNGTESRDFIHALDIAQAIECILARATLTGEVYNVATGREVKISELVEVMLASLGSRKRIVFDGIVPAGVPRNWKADISKLQDLGFSPTIVLEQGIKDFANWCSMEVQ